MVSVVQLESVGSEEQPTPLMNSRRSGEFRNCCATMIEKVATEMLDSDAHITNIESVIAKSGLSLREVSITFGGTRELFLAMTSELTDRMSAPLAVISMSADLRERLLEFGEHVLELCATSHWRALYRIAVTESIRQTGLAHDFQELGPGRLTQRLAGFLRRAQEEGALASADPHLLASHFLSPLLANLDSESSTPGPAISRAARRRYVRSLVDLFCGGVNGGRQPC